MSVSLKRGQPSSLEFFFEQRATCAPDKPDLADLCYVSAKDLRIWGQPELYNDLIGSLQRQLELTPRHSLLEAGCAAGFIAKGIAPLCQRYVGVDLASTAVQKAAGLGLGNASFRVADAMALPFEANCFDRALCQDVVTNFESFAPVEKMVRELFRVVVPGGRVLIGSVPDDDRKADFMPHALEVAKALERKFGPQSIQPGAKPPLMTQLRHWYLRKVRGVEPTISCYFFRKQDFLQLAEELDAEVSIQDVHASHPYRGFRFNVLFIKRAR